MFAEAFADFVNGKHAGADIDVIDFGLVKSVQGAILLPDKLDIAKTEVAIDDEVDDVGQIAENRHKAFGCGLLNAGLSGGPIHDRNKLLRRKTKGVTDD